MKFGPLEGPGKLETWKLQGELLVLNFFQCLGHLRHHFNLPCFFNFLWSPSLLHKSEGKGSQRATAQVFHEACWINRRNERALCLVHPLRKQLKIKSHIFLVFNSQTWNDRFPLCLVCLPVHSPQCVEVMLQTDFFLKQMRITHSLFLYSGEMENQHLNWRMSCISCNSTLQTDSSLFFSRLQVWLLLLEAAKTVEHLWICTCLSEWKKRTVQLLFFLALCYGSQWQGCDCDIWKNKVRGC